MNGQTFDYTGTWNGAAVTGSVFFRVDEIPSNPTDVASRIYAELSDGRSLLRRRLDWAVSGNSLSAWTREGVRQGHVKFTFRRG